MRVRLELFVEDMETSIGFYSRVLGFEVARNESGDYAVPSERRSRTWDRADLQAPRGGRVLHQGHSLVAAGARSLVDQAMLEYGQLPRSVMRRYAGISRRALQRHRAVCLEAKSSEDAA